MPGRIALRVAEARVEDIAHAVARMAPADLDRDRRQTGRHSADHRTHGGGGSGRGRRRGTRRVHPDRRHGAEQLRCGVGGTGDGHAGGIRAGRRGAARPAVVRRRARDHRTGPPAGRPRGRADPHGIGGPRADVREGRQLSGHPHDSRRPGRHRPALRHSRRRRRSDGGARARRLLRGHRRTRARGRARARDRRAPAEAFAAVRAARHPGAEGRAAATARRGRARRCSRAPSPPKAACTSST